MTTIVKHFFIAALLIFLLFPIFESFAFAADADHLIISEFLVKTRNPVSIFGSPFVEVTNPTAGAIDLSNVYLTDGTTAPVAYYYFITQSDPDLLNPGGGNGGDFHSKFPDGLILDAGQSLIISINGSTEFFEAYGRYPDFELFEDDLSPDEVAELEEAFPASINAGFFGGSNVPVLSDLAESIVLYQWDGTSDLVEDLDYVMWGSHEGVRVDKTGVTVGSQTYLDDTPVANQAPVAGAGPTFGHSFQRVSADEGDEISSGGNGITGHDETSENLTATWADVSPADPSPGLPSAFPSAPIFIDEEVNPQNPREGEEISLTAILSTFGEISECRFYYRVNEGSFMQEMATDEGQGHWSAVIPAQLEGDEIIWYCWAQNGLGGYALSPVQAPTYSNHFVIGEPPGPGPKKLLITEVNTGENIYPFEGMHQLAMEFIEIHNPNDVSVEMEDYYLTDAINYNYSTQLYWNIALGNPSQETIGGGHYNDFTARFPSSFQIEPRATITISVAGSDWFETFYGMAPDLELYEDGLEQDNIPDMRPVFFNPADDLPGDSIFTPDRPYGGSSDQFPKGIPELEEHYGEPMILYHWDEPNDLVTDIDYFVWGDGKTGDYRYGFDKTGVTVGQSTYQPDTPILDQDWFMPMDESGAWSYSRVDVLEGVQPTSGSNGVDGRDETGEDLSVTFQLWTPSPGVFYYPSSVNDELTIPAVYRLGPCIPNPFNPTTSFSFELPQRVAVDLRIYDLRGLLIRTLVSGEVLAQGRHEAYWNGRDTNDRSVAAGVYFYRLETVEYRETKRMVLVK